MARRFVLVGLLQVVASGTLLQLLLGTLTCFVYLVLQLQIVPYKDATNGYVALASSAALVLFFITCLVYTMALLVDVPEVHERMSREEQRRYQPHTLLVSAILIVTLLGTLVLAVGVVGAQVRAERRQQAARRRLRLKRTGDLVHATAIAGESYHLFLSHACARAGFERELAPRLRPHA